MADDSEGTFVPPYNVSWSTFLNTIERMGSDLPVRLDRSYLGSQSGNVQTYLIAAFKAFELVDDAGLVRPTLKALVEKEEDRPSMVAALLARFYPTLVALGKDNSTAGQLAEAFSAEFPGLTGESKTKAIRFFLSAAGFAGVQVSPHWKAPKPPKRSSGRPKPPTRTPSGGKGGTPQGEQGGGAPGSTRSVTLRSGGTVTLSYSVDLFSLSDEDDKFVRELIAKVRSYESASPSPPSSSADENEEVD